MKNSLVALVLWMSGPALAGWTGLGEDDASALYADPSAIVKQVGVATMSSLVDYKSFQRMVEVGYFSQTLRAEYDCQSPKSRGLARTLHSEHMGQGKVIYEDDTPHDWEDIQSGSRGESLWKLACK
ncbi:MAG: surface-adhesin E family protein [Betaproteobacteria bacterium]